MIYNSGGHGGAPDSARDPIVASASLILALQTIVSRNISPLDSGTCRKLTTDALGVISVTKVEAGTAGNIIPGSASIT